METVFNFLVRFIPRIEEFKALVRSLKELIYSSRD